MPLTPNQLQDRLTRAAAENRLAHAYLLCGEDLGSLEDTLMHTASSLLGEPATGHPDLHLVKPELKSRRISIEHIRDLERELYLRPYRAPRKVAGIVAADRMCIGRAEAANAFLKTLEEPPGETVIFLATTAPDQLLPTIRSRCLAITITPSQPPPDACPPDWLSRWLQAREASPTLTAYRRAALLSEFWNDLRGAAEKKARDNAVDGEDDDVLTARAEAEFQLRRDSALRAMARAIWAQRTPNSYVQAARAVDALEELRYALSRNLDASLCLERACLQLEGILE